MKHCKGLIGLIFFIIFLTGCKSEQTEKLLSEEILQAFKADKSVIAQKEIVSGTLIIYTNNLGYNISHVSQSGSICSGGNIEINSETNVTTSQLECASDKDNFQVLWGKINDNQIEKLEVNFKIANKSFKKVAEKIKTSDGAIFWYATPDKNSKYYMQLESILGTTIDGKVISDS